MTQSKESSLSINKVHFPVTTLGFGRRVGIWTQGCSIHCPGCINQDTWVEREDTHIAIPKLIDGISRWLGKADGVTISGGEPFDQPAALLLFVDALKASFAGDILIYSGYSLPKLLTNFPHILKSVDVLISEPFEAQAPQTRILRGSDNQIITLLSPLGRSRYPRDINERPWSNPRKFDVMIAENDAWMVGIPEKKMFGRLQKKLKGRGFESKSSRQPHPLA